MNDLFIQGLTIDWNRVRPYNYVRQIPAISGIDTFTFHKPVTFFVGENGSGKSTLLEAIAVAYGFNAEGGTKNYSFSTYNSHSELCEAMTISKGYRRPKFGYFLRAESFYNVATKEIDYSDDDHPSKGYHQKSHGESFLAIAQDYMGADLLCEGEQEIVSGNIPAGSCYSFANVTDKEYIHTIFMMLEPISTVVLVAISE